MIKNLIFIPCNLDIRSYLFGDPCVGTDKHIYLYDKDNQLISIIDHNGHTYINTDTNEYFVRHSFLSYINNVPEYFKQIFPESFI